MALEKASYFNSDSESEHSYDDESYKQLRKVLKTIESGNLEALKAFQKAGVDMHQSYDVDWYTSSSEVYDDPTLMHHAVQCGQIAIFDFLYGTYGDKKNPNFPDAIGQTLVHYGVMSGKPEMLRHVLDLGGDVNVASLNDYEKGANGETPLHVVAKWCNSDGEGAEKILQLVQMLLEAGANVQSRNGHEDKPIKTLDGKSLTSAKVFELLYKKGSIEYPGQLPELPVSDEQKMQAVQLIHNSLSSYQVKELTKWGKEKFETAKYEAKEQLSYDIFDKVNKDGWDKTLLELGNGKYIGPMEDAMGDYAKALVVPAIALELHKSDKKALATFANQLNAEMVDKLCTKHAKGIVEKHGVLGLVALNKHWHEPLQQTAFQKLRDHHRQDWPSIFQSAADSRNNHVKTTMAIPDGVVEQPGLYFEVLTTSKLLKEEGDRLQHCVGGYTQKCTTGSSHIISIRKANEVESESLSTIEIETYYRTKTFSILQHYGVRNGAPCATSVKACNWLEKEFREGRIAIDYEHLSTEYEKRHSEGISPEQKIADFLGFNPFSEGNGAKVRNAYHTHTPKYLWDALKTHMSHISMELGGQERVVVLDQKRYEKEQRQQQWLNGGRHVSFSSKEKDNTSNNIQKHLNSLCGKDVVAVSLVKDGQNQNSKFGEVELAFSANGQDALTTLTRLFGDKLQLRQNEQKINNDNNAVGGNDLSIARISGLSPRSVEERLAREASKNSGKFIE